MEGLWSEGNGDTKAASKGKMEASHFLEGSGSQLGGDFALQETFGNGDIFVVMMAEGVGGHATAGI